MAEINPAYVIGQASNPARMFRQALTSIYGNAQGVLTATDLAVTGTTGTTTVSVAAGSAVITGSHASYQGSYLVTNDAAKSVALGTAPTTVGYSRIDRIVARIKDRDYSDASDAWSLEVVPGTPAASPTAPAITFSSYLELAQVTSSQAAGGIASSGVVDKRVVNSPGTGPAIVTTTLLANQTPTASTEGQMVYDTVADQFLVNHGGSSPAWRAPWNLPWGILGVTAMPALAAASAQTMTTTPTTLSWGSTNCTVTQTLLANRRYRVVAVVPEVSSNVADDTVQAQIFNTTSGIIMNRQLIQLGKAGVSHSITVEAQVTGSGSTTFACQLARAEGTGTISVSNSALLSQTMLYVEDVGSYGSPA